MAYGKKILRNGKEYGEYYYTSIRINGKIYTVYLGKNKPDKNEEGRIKEKVRAKIKEQIKSKEQS